ncbi:MAG: tRNA pseudouridine(38-40) synthase TruA [Ruminococcaceae bacterium]|nr:tRNA pseudouridine(38-40) synthase TruA [Oscillospiraceae bacterium]
MTERRERNIALRLRYDGSAYHGWQFQQNALSLQEVLETALRRLTGEELPRGVFGCSRTDAGVHARTYVANFQTRCTIPADRFPAALRPFLPPDLSLVAALDVPEDFHARFSCVGKEYVYRIYGGKAPDPFLYHRAHYYPYPLDIEKMDTAARLICGKRDFKVFMATGSIVKDTCRNVWDCRVEERDGVAEITISADGFLYNMVRIIAGTLVAVSDGKIVVDEIPELIERGDRTKAGVTLPPHGLYLNRIWYASGEASEWIR